MTGRQDVIFQVTSGSLRLPLQR